MLVLIAVCCSERPIASATLMNRFAKSVSRIGSGAPMEMAMLMFEGCGGGGGESQVLDRFEREEREPA